MTNVIAWPPFTLTGWDIYDSFPRSRSVGIIQGKTRDSSALRTRRLATCIVDGLSSDFSASGYVRMLNRQWGTAPRLTRVNCYSSTWIMASLGETDLRSNFMEWEDGGTELLWTVPSEDLLWSDNLLAFGVPTTDGGFPAISVTGFPANAIIARPSDMVKVRDGAGGEEQSYALGIARTDATGAAVIRLETAISIEGLPSIGENESIVFEAQDVPRSVQTPSGVPAFAWDFVEVFEDEYADGWDEVNPWP